MVAGELQGVQHQVVYGAVQVGLLRPGEARPPAGIDVAAPVQLSVCDSGPGIPEDEVTRIFDPFYTTRPDGNGLGLAVVHRAVEAHRGAVLAGNGSLGGAEFTLYLPGREETR